MSEHQSVDKAVGDKDQTSQTHQTEHETTVDIHRLSLAALRQRRPRPMRPQDVLKLQRHLGNRATQQIIQREEAKKKDSTSPTATNQQAPTAQPTPKKTPPTATKDTSGKSETSSAKTAPKQPKSVATKPKSAKKTGTNGPTSTAPVSSGKSRGEAQPEQASSEASSAASSSDVAIKMPPPPETPSSESQQRMGQVQERAAVTASEQEELPPSAEHVTEARDAVTEPDEEIDARAEQELIQELGSQPEPSLEIEELCARIRQVIRNKRPPDEDSLVNADPEAMAQAAGQELNQSLEGKAEDVEESYEEMEEEQEGEATREPEPTEELPPAEQTQNINAQEAKPDPIPDEDTSLDEDVEANQQKIEEAGMTSEPAALVESGPIAEAREAQEDLEQTAEEDVAVARAKQQEALVKADTDMAALQAQALQSLQESRAQTVTNVGGQQNEMVGSEEQMRQQVGQQANTIYSNAQSSVDDLMKEVPEKAREKWDAGIGDLSQKFKDDLRVVEEKIEERHSGVLGDVVEWWDSTFGLPGWATEAYDNAERNFGDGVCNLLREISTEVNGIVASAHAIIEKAREDINTLYDQLPANLQEWATQERAKFDEKLNGLSQSVNETRDNFNQELINLASNAVQEVRQEVHGLREKAKGLVGKIADAITTFLEDPAKFIINGLLELVGIVPAAFWAVVNRIKSAIDSIAEDPVGFANNLMEALKQGFQMFFNNIGTHLLDGLIKWLFARMDSVGIEIPSDFSLKSIITFFLQIMGISWAKIRQLIAKHVGEENVALIEQAWEVISTFIAEGPAGIFEWIKDKINPKDILDTILQTAIDFVIETLIKQVTMRIIGMLNPAGAIVQAIEAIYKVLNWLFENAAKIFSLIETIVGGIQDIIAGNIGGMAAAIEKTLAGVLPVVIDFLADLLGLGGLPDKVADAVKGVQGMVESVLDEAIGWLVDKAKGLLKSMGLGGEEEDTEGPNTGDEDKDQKIGVALTSIRTKEPEHRDEDSITRDEAQQIASQVSNEQQDIESIQIVDGGTTWDYNLSFVQRTTIKSTQATDENTVKQPKLVDVPDRRELPDNYDVRYNLYTGRGSGWSNVRTQFRDSEFERIEREFILELVDSVQQGDIDQAENIISELEMEQLINPGISAHQVATWYQDGGMQGIHKHMHYEVDHDTPVAFHWVDEGYKSSDQERWQHAIDITNLQLLTQHFNRGKGSEHGGEQYHYGDQDFVTPEFTSKYVSEDRLSIDDRGTMKRFKNVEDL